jgi:hypothetical protein
MRKSVKWTLISAAVIVAGGLGLGFWSHAISLSAGRCLTDDEIPSVERAPYELEAIRFVNAIVNSDTGTAYADLTSEVKHTLSPDQFKANVQPLGPILVGLKSTHAVHLFYLTSIAAGADHMTPCTAVAHGSISSPEGRVVVAAKSLPVQAHVIVEGETNNNIWTFALWLLPEDGSRRVQSFWATASAMVGKSGADIWALAREQRSRGHVFNAAVLYAAANDLAYRGPKFQLGIAPEIQKEAKELQLPPDLQGSPPFSWQFGATAYRVLRVGPIGVGGKLALMIRQELPALADNDEADGQNRALIHAFAEAYPEYSDVFDAIVVEAVDAHGLRGFRTVEETQRAP